MRVLKRPPVYYGVEYKINLWMSRNESSSVKLSPWPSGQSPHAEEDE